MILSSLAPPVTPALSHFKQPSRRGRGGVPWNFADWFVLSQTFLPALLYIPGSQPFRVPIRLACYGITLLALAYYWIVMRRSGRSHPATLWLGICLAYLALMILHPTTNSFMAGMAQVGVYISVLAPVFWAPAFVQSAAHLKRLLWLFLLCNGINSFVGVMQVHDPAVWMPREFSSVITNSAFGIASLAYTGANGQMVIRPPGLGDAPGAVCGPAVFALYLGLVFSVADRVWWKKLFALLFATLGAAAIFLTLVRTSLLIAVGMIIVYIVLQVGQGRPFRAVALVIMGVVAITTAFLRSTEVGGESIVSRFHTLFEENPKDFYSENRGNQVAAGFTNLLPEYPFGAGLGRWGMMGMYFGNPNNRDSPPIWVEIQLPAWIVDGGIVLLVCYLFAIFVMLRQAWRLARGAQDGRTRSLAAIILAANIGMAANCLSYPVFCSPTGMQFWFLAGALQGVAAREGSARTHRRRSTIAESMLPAPVMS